MIQGCSGIWAGPRMTRTLSVIGLQRLDKKYEQVILKKQNPLGHLWFVHIPNDIPVGRCPKPSQAAQIEPQSPCCMLGCQGCALRPQNAKDWMQRIVKRVGYGRITKTSQNIQFHEEDYVRQFDHQILEHPMFAEYNYQLSLSSSATTEQSKFGHLS